jgi:putative tryptophan/tyrosine transport system substrate-binding protein
VKLRAFLPALVLATIGASFPVSAQQSDKVHRIAHLAVGPVLPAATFESHPFRRALRERGLIEGRNLVTDLRFATTQEEARPLAAAMVRTGPSVITVLSGALANIVRQETTTIPIVTLAAGDLVSMGLVASLAQPGGNVTGVQVLQTDLAGKRLSVLREMVPGLRKASALGSTGLATSAPGSAFFASVERELEKAGAGLGIAVQMRSMGSAGPGPLFAEMAAQGTQGLLLMGGSGTWTHRAEIFELALRNRIATMCDTSAFVVPGCLVSYGFSGEEVGQRAAAIVDKILKGASPARIPVEQPTKFEFVINLKTARALGISVPQSLLVRADEVIQ